MTRNAFITGSGGGLGVAVVERFLAAGWNVTAPRRAEVDLNDPEAVRRAVAAAAPLHAVVNLAGGFAAGEPVAETPVEAFEASLRAQPAHHLHRLPRGDPGPRRTTARSSARRRRPRTPFAGSAGYAASKAGVIALLGDRQGGRALQRGLALADRHAREPRVDAGVAWGKLVPPERIAEVVLWLCSPESAALNGVDARSRGVTGLGRVGSRGAWRGCWQTLHRHIEDCGGASTRPLPSRR